MKEPDNTPIEDLNVDWGNPDGTGRKAKTLEQVQKFIKDKIRILENKPIVTVADAIGNITILQDSLYEIHPVGNISILTKTSVITSGSVYWELSIITGETTYALSFPDNINWVKPLDEILPNARYLIIIDQNLVGMWAAVSN